MLSIHAFRVTIACALAKWARENDIKDIEPKTQAIARWKSLEALRIYQRMSQAQYADLVDAATTTDACLYNGDRIANIEAEDAGAAIAQAINELEGRKPAEKRPLPAPPEPTPTGGQRPGRAKAP